MINNNFLKLFDKNVFALNQVKNNINLDKLNVFYNNIKNEKCLYLTGIGKNYHIASIIASTFNSLTLRTILFDSVHAVHGDMGMIEDKSPIILISKSGNTDELIFFCKKLQKRNCGSKIYLIHSNENCELKKYSFFDLYIPKVEESDPWNRVPTCSLITYLAVLHSVGMKIVEYKKVTVDDFYKNHPGGDIGKSIL